MSIFASRLTIMLVDANCSLRVLLRSMFFLFLVVGWRDLRTEPTILELGDTSWPDG